MRRNRRLVLIDRIIPFLAAGVGLLALAGAMVVQSNVEARTAALAVEVASLRAAAEAVGQRAEQLAAAADNGTAEGLLALQERMVALEGEMQALRAESELAAAAAPVQEAAAEATSSAAIDPNLPVTDCIPLGTRFMVVPNETYPLCQSRAVVKVGAITGETIAIEGAGTVPEAGFAPLAGTSCSVMVFSADIEGFAELRVTCT